MDRRYGWLVAAAVMWAPPIRAASEWQFGLAWGSTDYHASLVRMIASGPRSFKLRDSGTWLWQITPEISLGHWFNDADDHHLWEAGLTPVLEVQRPLHRGVLALNLGVGAHVLSDTQFDGNRLGSAFQFADHVGIEWQFTEARWAIGYRFQHLSNGGIQPPNEGVNFHLLQLMRHF